MINCTLLHKKRQNRINVLSILTINKRLIYRCMKLSGVPSQNYQKSWSNHTSVWQMAATIAKISMLHESDVINFQFSLWQKIWPTLQLNTWLLTSSSDFGKLLSRKFLNFKMYKLFFSNFFFFIIFELTVWSSQNPSEP